MENEKIFISGGAGFIGTHLTQELLKSNKVIVLDNFSTGFKENLQSNKNLKIVEGDVRKRTDMEKLTKGCSYIFNLASYIPNIIGHTIRASWSQLDLTHDTTIFGTLNLLEAARKNDCKFLFTSTAAVYGDSTEEKLRENSETNPVSPYGLFKLAAEKYCEFYSRVNGIETIITRTFNCYGPLQRKYIMFDLLSKLSKDKNNLELHGDGTQIRDYIFIKDFVKAVSIILDKKETGIFNIGNGEGQSVIQIVDAVTKQLKMNPKIKFEKTPWGGDIHKLVADNTKLKKLGYNPEFSMKDGIAQVINWFNRTEL